MATNTRSPDRIAYTIVPGKNPNLVAPSGAIATFSASAISTCQKCRRLLIVVLLQTACVRGTYLVSDRAAISSREINRASLDDSRGRAIIRFYRVSETDEFAPWCR